MFDFNLDEIEEVSSVVPKGSYLVQVEKAELITTKKGGQMINVQFDIISEVQNGRKLFEGYNIVNESTDAVKIGLGHIKSLILASGASMSKFTSPDQLIGLECQINVKVTTDEEYGEGNKITNYKKPAMPTTLPAQGETPVNAEGHTTTVPAGENGKPIF